MMVGVWEVAEDETYGCDTVPGSVGGVEQASYKEKSEGIHQNLQANPLADSPRDIGAHELTIHDIRSERDDEEGHDGEVKTSFVHRDKFSSAVIQDHQQPSSRQ